MSGKDERHESRAIVVTVPKTELNYVYFGKFFGEGNGFYWTLRQIPAHPVDRVYFVWNGAVRAWHGVEGFENEPDTGPLVVLAPEHHEIEPVPMNSFRGYRWFVVE